MSGASLVSKLSYEPGKAILPVLAWHVDNARVRVTVRRSSLTTILVQLPENLPHLRFHPTRNRRGGPRRDPSRHR